MMMHVRLAALATLCALAPAALARDDGRYADADPARKAWFHALKQPGTGVSCCDASDCRPVEYDIRGGVYWARLADDRGDWGWHAVPAERVITDPAILRNNPTGSAVACWIGPPQQPHLYCFVPGSGL